MYPCLLSGSSLASQKQTLQQVQPLPPQGLGLLFKHFVITILQRSISCLFSRWVKAGEGRIG